MVAPRVVPFLSPSNIFLTKLENEKVAPMKPTFYKRFVDDDVITRRQMNHPDCLLEVINNYHHNIKFTVEQNPSKFLDINLTTNIEEKSPHLYIGSQTNFPLTGLQRCQNSIKGTPSMVILVDLIILVRTLNMKN